MFIVTAIITVFVIAVVILTLLAINHLHKIPQILDSMANIEKLLKTLIAIEKKKIGDEKPETEQAGDGQ